MENKFGKCPMCGSAETESNGGWEFRCNDCFTEFEAVAFTTDTEAPISNEDAKEVVANVYLHKMICNNLNELYARKNHDYGDSFHKTWLEEGPAMARIRLVDKLERFKKLSKAGVQEVKDESIIDTLLDLANYSIMTAMEYMREDE